MKMFRSLLFSLLVLAWCVGPGVSLPLAAEEPAVASDQRDQTDAAPNTSEGEGEGQNSATKSAESVDQAAAKPNASEEQTQQSPDSASKPPPNSSPTTEPSPKTQPAPAAPKVLPAPPPVRVRSVSSPHVSVFGNSRSEPGETAEAVVTVFGNSDADGPVENAVVSVFGNAHAADDVGESVVAVFGNSTAEKNVGEDVVAIFGNARANGHVYGKVVSIFGTVQLGPQAVVDGELVCMFGSVNREPGSVVHGRVNSVNRFDTRGIHGATHFFQDTIFRGRLLYFSPRAVATWVIATGFLAFYVLLALAFSGGVTRCAETLEQRPGRTILAALLALLLTPVLIILFVVLLLTVVGPFVLALALLIGHLFGKAAVLAFIGRRFVKRPGSLGAALAVLLGGIVVMLIYTIPFIGLLFWKISSVLGFGMVLYTMILTNRRNREQLNSATANGVAGGPANGAMTGAGPGATSMASHTASAAASTAAMATGAAARPTRPSDAAAVPNVSNESQAISPTAATNPGAAGVAPGPDPLIPPVPPPPAVSSAGTPVSPTSPSSAPSAPPVAPVPPLPPLPPLPPVPPMPPRGVGSPSEVDFRAMPRAGFWLRLAAAGLDCVLVAVICVMLHLGEYFLPAYAIYCFVMWALKSTTIGGIICGVRIVRLDGRKIDWTIALVRVLGAFLSAAVVFLGFIWVSFDEDAQSWHDRIAGTTIVRVPKGASLV